MDKSIMVPADFISKVKKHAKKKGKTIKKLVIEIIKKNAEGAKK